MPLGTTTTAHSKNTQTQTNYVRKQTYSLAGLSRCLNHSITIVSNCCCCFCCFASALSSSYFPSVREQLRKGAGPCTCAACRFIVVDQVFSCFYPSSYDYMRRTRRRPICPLFLFLHLNGQSKDRTDVYVFQRRKLRGSPRGGECTQCNFICPRV